ncbi:MAG TPA: GAF domain-containing protein, partial [Terriglobales bacterium]|nr:GAF domain-containing protein [Terriglobales bacterium]
MDATAAKTQVPSPEQAQKAITQLSRLFEATLLLNSTLDLAELLDRILQIARTECHADRGTVFLADSKKHELWSIVASGLDHQEIRVPYGRGVAGRVAETGEIINVEDAYTLEYFDRSFDQKFGYRTRSLLCLPIRHKTGEIVGVIQLLNQVHGRFEREDEDFLTKLSAHMAMALENARL